MFYLQIPKVRVPFGLKPAQLAQSKMGAKLSFAHFSSERTELSSVDCIGYSLNQIIRELKTWQELSVATKTN